MPSSLHPCSYFVPTTQRTGVKLKSTPAPNQDERRARHLRQCERLAELGMELAEAAHVEALADIQPRPARRPSIVPGDPDVVGSSLPRDTEFGHLFAQLARCVRQTILLEARLAAGTLDRIEPAPGSAPASPTPPLPNPIRPVANEARPRLCAEPMEDESRENVNRTPEEILTDICAGLGHALQAGLTPERPAQAALRQDKPAKPCGPLDPPPPSQFERSVRAAIQQGIPPPPGWR